MADRCGFSILDLGPPMLAAARLHGHSLIADPFDGVHLRPMGMGEMAIAMALFRFISIQCVPFAFERA
ncbi:MAG: hypothetical protein WCH98_00995 [Verrucomicrobiota bacterium]